MILLRRASTLMMIRGDFLTYEELLIHSDFIGLTVKEKPLTEHDGLICGKRIAIRQDIPTLQQKACVLAEELGHYHTGSGNILDQNDSSNRKQENRGRLHAYNRMIGLIGIINAFNNGCRNLYEMADYLNVTEDFLQEALEGYRRKYGMYACVDNYIIYFEPHLNVVKMI